MKGLLARKLDMTQFFDKSGNVIPVTALNAGPCYVSQIKGKAKNGYLAVQIAFEECAEKKINKPVKGHLKKAGLEKNYRHLVEFSVDEKEKDNYQPGQCLKADIFQDGEKVSVTGISKGKGFMGPVRRHHFNRGPMSHGSKHHRLHGSNYSGTSPGNLKKGRRMAGRMGGERVTLKNALITLVDADKNLIYIKGAVPGPTGGLVLVRA